MGWHDDDFPNEDTDPSMTRGGSAQRVPQQVPGGHPQQTGYPPQQQGAYPPQQQGGYPPQQQGGYPPQQQGYPQQGPPSGAVPIQQGPPSGVVPIQQPPNPTPSGGYPQQGYAPNTGGFPQQQGPPQSPSQVQKLAAPVVAVEEDAKASRVVYGLSGTAVGGVAGVVLGVLNTKLEGLTITEGTDFIFMCAIWFSFFTGLMCFLFPDRFAYTIMQWTEKDEDDIAPPPTT